MMDGLVVLAALIGGLWLVFWVMVWSGAALIGVVRLILGPVGALALIAVLLVVMTACASRDERQHAYCAGELGLERGTAGYAQCRLLLEQQAAAKQRQFMRGWADVWGQ